jgi:arylsulfatase A-like enzyme
VARLVRQPDQCRFKGTTIGNPRDWVPPGWNLWYAFSGTRPKYYDYSINDNGKMLSFGSALGDYSTDVLKERAVRFIQDQSASPAPFFLFVAPKSVHAEGTRAIPSPQYKNAFKDVRLPESPAFNEKDLRRKAIRAPRVGNATRDDLGKTYRAALRSLQSVDDLVAAVVAALKDTGKLDNTVVIYTSSIRPTTVFCSGITGWWERPPPMKVRSRCRSSCAVRASPRIRPAISS